MGVEDRARSQISEVPALAPRSLELLSTQLLNIAREEATQAGPQPGAWDYRIVEGLKAVAEASQTAAPGSPVGGVCTHGPVSP